MLSSKNQPKKQMVKLSEMQTSAREFSHQLREKKRGLIIFGQNLSIHPIVLSLNTPAVLAALIFINSAGNLLFNWFL